MLRGKTNPKQNTSLTLITWRLQNEGWENKTDVYGGEKNAHEFKKTPGVQKGCEMKNGVIRFQVID